MKPIRLLIVDDHEVVRVGLRMLLARFPTIEVVGDASSVATAVAETQRLSPDVILMDIRLGDGTGFDACREIQKLPLETRVLILTSFADDDLVAEAIAAGTDGYLLKEIDSERLVNAIERVAQGQSILDPAITRQVLDRMRHPEEASGKDKLDLLSAQERKVMALVALGKTNKEIGVDMGLSDKTVKNYLSNILDKLHYNRRSQVAAFYVRHTPRQG